MFAVGLALLLAVWQAQGSPGAGIAATSLRSSLRVAGTEHKELPGSGSGQGSPVQGGGACSTDADCSLNGVCQGAQGCVCDPWWTGTDCSLLNLLPAAAEQKGAAYGFSPNVTSWGGNPVLINSTYHLFVTEIGYGCFLSKWQDDSTVVHAVSDTPAGPYTKVSTVLLPEAHNPETLLLPNGSLVMFHIGEGNNKSYSPCSKGANPPDDGSATGGLRKGGGVYHVADRPEGPWVPVPLNIGCNNPAPMILPNGTVYLVCKDSGFYLYRAARLGADFALMFKLPPSTPGSGAWEDPFLYRDQRDNWHIIAHSWNHTDDFDISGHYFSPDGLNWTASQTQPFGHTAQLSDGSVLEMRTRERPKLLFDAQGRPTHLFNGINTNAYCPSPASSCKTRKGYDWDYTFVQPLAQS